MITRRFARILAVAALSLGLTGGATSAATFLFDDTGGDSGTTTQNYTSGGLELDVTSSGGNIDNNANGLGVVGAPGGGRMSGTETLTFVFTGSVRLIESIIFEVAGGTDDITITDGFGTLLASFTVGDGTVGNSLQTVALNLVGDTFVFTRTGGTGLSAGVRIRELTAVIPAPAALPLMIGGVGLLGFTARRRQKARRN